MEQIIRGTTPTVKFTFATVDVTTISVAYLTILSSEGTVLLTKDMDTAEVGEDYISWTLTQTETLVLPLYGKVQVWCDWRIADGTRGRSKIAEYTIGVTGKNEVI